MPDANACTTPASSSWRVSFLPTVMLIGWALPITFLSVVEQYLFYLRPLELIPTYGTAWLFLGAPCIPASWVMGIFLNTLDRRRETRALRRVLVALLVGIAATALVAAFANGVVVWLRTFGCLSQVHVIVPLSVGSVTAGMLIGATRAGRRTLLELYTPAKFAMALGGLSLVSLPFTGWGSDKPAGAVGAGAGSVVNSATASTRPNILLVTIDTLSAEHMSLYGAARPTTPNIDAFAGQATVFDRAYSNGNFTTPGIASIVTGTRPWTHRALQLQSWPDVDARRHSLPALLQQAGYQTAYVGSGTWAGAERNGMAGYFDFRMPDADSNITLCRDGLSGVLRYDCATTQLAPFFFTGTIVEKIREIAFNNPPNWHFDPRKAIRPALAWLAGADKRTPIFLWIHLMPPHSPYAAPEPWLGEFDSSHAARDIADSDSEDAFLFSLIDKDRAYVLAARYDEAVNYVDHFVGEYLDRSLKLLGDNTVVIVTSDHGESFAHGYGKHTGPGLFESIIHIPLIIKLPHQTQGSRTSFVTEQVDIAPTIADLAGLSPNSSWEGHSLLNIDHALQPEAMTAAQPVFSMNFEQNPRRASLTTGSVAVVDGKWKLVHYMGKLHYRLMPELKDQLYDLSVDPAELTNRISERPDVAGRLLGLISAQLIRHGGALP